MVCLDLMTPKPFRKGGRTVLFEEVGQKRKSGVRGDSYDWYILIWDLSWCQYEFV